MSSYSEVGLVLKNKKCFNLFCDYFALNNVNRDDYHNDKDAEKFKKKGEILLIWTNVNHFSKDSHICKALLDLDEEDYYLVEACYEYPYESLTLGSYEDNAFSLEKEVIVRLSYQD